MKKGETFKRTTSIPKKAVLLIPDPEHETEPPAYGIKPGYYDSKQLLQLVEKHKNEPAAVQFIADMLETGDPENDSFAEMLRTNSHNAGIIGRILKAAAA